MKGNKLRNCLLYSSQYWRIKGTNFNTSNGLENGFWLKSFWGLKICVGKILWGLCYLSGYKEERNFRNSKKPFGKHFGNYFVIFTENILRLVYGKVWESSVRSSRKNIKLAQRGKFFMPSVRSNWGLTIKFP